MLGFNYPNLVCYQILPKLISPKLVILAFSFEVLQQLGLPLRRITRALLAGE
jgi:hypothetical protein